MTVKSWNRALAAILLTTSTVPTWAHHAFAAEFDADKPIDLQGTVTKIKWVNPHSWLYFDVKSGLLVRRRHEVRTPLGVLPSEYDYEDYRAVDNLQVPFKMTWSRADYKVTHKFDEVVKK